MENLQYLECQNCGTIHYLISEIEAKTLIKSGVLFDEFSCRNLECCSNCGTKDNFLKVSQAYADDYSSLDKIPAILLSKS